MRQLPYLLLLLLLFCRISLLASNNFAITISLNATGTTCGKNNGKIIVTATGGVAPYTYQINAGTPQPQNIFIFLTAGTYTITVTDAIGETATANTSLTNQFTAPNPPVVTSVQPPTGCATQDGSITLNSTGGTPPYLYSLDRTNFQPNNTWTNMDAGSFWAAVQDANGCISPFQLITANIPGNCPIQHNGINLSSVCSPFRSNLGLMNVSGGTAPYLYSLDGVTWQSNYLFFPLPAGTYTVFVKDAVGTLMRFMVGIFDPCFSNFLVNGTVTLAQCGANGSITVTATQGNAPYTYSIDGINFQVSNQFTGLASGNYTITVKDLYGFISSKFFIVGDAGCLSVTATTINSSCGRANGSIQVQGSNGTAPYQFAIGSGSFSTNNQFNNLLAGTYTIHVKDANGSTGTTPVTISDIAGPSIVSVAGTTVSCTGNDGTITVTAQNGTAPLQYSINGIFYQSSNIFSGLSAINYTVYTKDANGCISQAPITLTLNNNITANAGNPVTICEGDKIILTAQSNGMNFLWSPATGLNSTNSLTPQASPVVTTEYELTATLGGCSTTSKVIVTVNKAPVPIASKDTTICLGKSVQLEGSGGSSFNWSPAIYLDNRTAINPVVVNPPVGNLLYSLMVTDNNNCSSLTPATVKVAVAALKVNAGRDTIVQVGQPLHLKAVDSNNSGFLNYSWSPSIGLDNPFRQDPIAILTSEIHYTLTATAGGGCTATDDIFVKVFRDINIYVPTAFTPNNDGRNDILKAIPVGIKTFRHLSIYNRAGTLIFRTTDAAKGWDGTYRGALQQGVHVWAAEGIDYKGNLLNNKGTVMVVR